MKQEEMLKDLQVYYIRYIRRYPYIDRGYISCVIDSMCVINGELHHCSNVSTSRDNVKRALYRVLKQQLKIFAKLFVEIKKEL